MEYARKKDSVKKYLPDEKDWIHLDRQWLGDVLYTVETKDVTELINKAKKQRKDKVEEKEHELVDMKPEFNKAFEQCMNFSSTLTIL